MQSSNEQRGEIKPSSGTNTKKQRKIIEGKDQRSLPEKAMSTHSSTLAWKIPWMKEPGRLQYMGSLRVVHDLVASLSLFTFTHWKRKCQPTPVFLPGESQGWQSLVGFHLWGLTESDTTEATQQQQQQQQRSLQENYRNQGNISCKDEHNIGQKWYGPNRSRIY